MRTNARHPFQFGIKRHKKFQIEIFVVRALGNFTRVDIRRSASNNSRVDHPQPVRRIKTYSAENGAVYQYQFHEVRPATVGGEQGSEYIYYVTSDRQAMHAVRVFVSRTGIEKWIARNSRILNSTEEYAVAKMRLFQGFDEVPAIEKSNTVLHVDETNIAALLEKLDL
jgi:hypothetical protein